MRPLGLWAALLVVALTIGLLPISEAEAQTPSDSPLIVGDGAVPWLTPPPTYTVNEGGELRFGVGFTEIGNQVTGIRLASDDVGFSSLDCRWNENVRPSAVAANGRNPCSNHAINATHAAIYWATAPFGNAQLGNWDNWLSVRIWAKEDAGWDDDFVRLRVEYSTGTEPNRQWHRPTWGQIPIRIMDNDEAFLKFRQANGQDFPSEPRSGYWHEVSITENGPAASYYFALSQDPDVRNGADRVASTRNPRVRVFPIFNYTDGLECMIGDARNMGSATWGSCAGIYKDLSRHGDRGDGQWAHWGEVKVRAKNGHFDGDLKYTVTHGYQTVWDAQRGDSIVYGNSSRVTWAPQTVIRPSPPYTTRTPGIVSVQVKDCPTCPAPLRAQSPGQITFHNSRADAQSGANPFTELDLVQGADPTSYWVRLSAEYTGGSLGASTERRNRELGGVQSLDVRLPKGADAHLSDGWSGDAANFAQGHAAVFNSPDNRVMAQLKPHLSYAGPKQVYVYLKPDARCSADSHDVTHAVHGGGFPFASAPLTLNYQCPRVSFAQSGHTHDEHQPIVKRFHLLGVEHRLSRYDVVLNLNPAPTREVDLAVGYDGTARWLLRQKIYGSIHDDTFGELDGIHSALTGDYYVSYRKDGADRYCGEEGGYNNRNLENMNCQPAAGGEYRGHFNIKIPASATTHKLKVFVWDDEVHDSGETVTLSLLQPGTDGSKHYALGSRSTFTLTIRNDEPAPPPEDPNAPPPGPDLEAEAPAEAHAEVLWNGDALVGWPDYDGESEVHVRARSANRNGTKWCYNQTGNWCLLTGMAADAWIIEVMKTDFATRLSGRVYLKMPEAEDLPEPPDTATPVVSITPGNDITEGGTATFTVSASPAPAEPMSVSIAVSQSGNYAADGTTGAKSVTIPTTGSVPYKVVTVDDGNDEADGSITIAVSGSGGYTVGTSASATVSVSDDDVPVVSIAAGSGIEEGGTATFTVSASPAPHSPLAVSLAVSQSGDYAAAGTTGTKSVTVPITGSETYTVDTVDDGNDEADGSVTVSLSGGQGYTVGSTSSATVNVSDDDDPPVQEPTVSISGGSGVTEGGTATFTVTASPAPASPLTVSLSVSQSGDYAADGTTGTKTVTIPTTGSAPYSVDTVNDTNDEADGSVTVSLSNGSGYTVGSTSSATVSVSDDDDPPAQTPEVSISGGSGVTEGGTATFTVTASPAPASPLTVSLSVSQSGDYAADGETGTKSVTIPTSGSAPYSVDTVDDTTDEPDGSVTVSLSGGQGYTVGTSSSATVSVSDNDDPVTPGEPPPPPDLDADPPDEAQAEIWWKGDVLVGWPDYDGESEVFVRARSASGHGTIWCENEDGTYNQSGNWCVLEGLESGTWIIQVMKTDFATILSRWVVLEIP